MENKYLGWLPFEAFHVSGSVAVLFSSSLLRKSFVDELSKASWSKERTATCSNRFVRSTLTFLRGGWRTGRKPVRSVCFNDDLFSSTAVELTRGCFVSQQEAIEFYFPTCARAKVSPAMIEVSRRKKRECNTEFIMKRSRVSSGMINAS